MIRKFISQVDGAEFQYRFNGINLELKLDGCDWSDFIPEDKRAYSEPEYKELMSLLKVVRNEPRFCNYLTIHFKSYRSCDIIEL